MKILKMRLQGFSSFKDTGWIVFGPVINLIVGQNNVGKSALLRAFETHLPDQRHRDDSEFEEARLPAPRLDLSVALSGRELEDALLRKGGGIYWPLSDGHAFDSETIFSSPHSFQIYRNARAPFYAASDPLHGQFEGPSQYRRQLSVKDGRLVDHKTNVENSDNIVEAIEPFLAGNLFSFSAQRFSVGKCGYGRADRLVGNCQNLAAILFRMMGEQATCFRHSLNIYAAYFQRSEI